MLLIVYGVLGENMKPVILLVLLGSVLAGCASTSESGSKSLPQQGNSQPFFVQNAVIAEPLSVDYKTELHIAKLTQAIHKSKSTKESLAQLLYDRGVLYDSLGLRTLAHLDFLKALELKPSFADAYNFLGIHLTLLGRYEQAFEAFDSVLELQPDHGYVHLNRGIALHYFGSRDELSAQDIETFYINNPKDPYRAIWLYLAESKLNLAEAKLRLEFNASQLDSEKWAYQIIQLYLGQVSESDFIYNMAKNLDNTRQLSDRLCEGYFYLAKYKLAQGDEDAAKNYFRLALSTNVYEFVEHKYAKVELQRLYAKNKALLEQTQQPQ